MPAYFEEGFMVRAPAWHGMGHIFDEYPGREEAMKMAGHDFTIVTRPAYVPQFQPIASTWGDLSEKKQAQLLARVGKTDASFLINADGVFEATDADAYKSLVEHRPGHEFDGRILTVANETRGVVQPEVLWDLIDALVGEGIKYETGLRLGKNGCTLSILAYLDEPYTVPGDDSAILPFVSVSIGYDGTSALTCRPTSIRVVCMNTHNAAEAEGVRNKNAYVFKQTKNVMAHVEEAKTTMKGLRATQQDFIELTKELASVKLSTKQRKMFVSQFIPMPPEFEISPRVKSNVEEARELVMSLFDGKSVADAHRFTGYGAWCAGTEYLDHLRPTRNKDTKYGRQLMKDEPLKARLKDLILECASA